MPALSPEVVVSRQSSHQGRAARRTRPASRRTIVWPGVSGAAVREVTARERVSDTSTRAARARIDGRRPVRSLPRSRAPWRLTRSPESKRHAALKSGPAARRSKMVRRSTCGPPGRLRGLPGKGRRARARIGAIALTAARRLDGVVVRMGALLSGEKLAGLRLPDSFRKV